MVQKPIHFLKNCIHCLILRLYLYIFLCLLIVCTTCYNHDTCKIPKSIFENIALYDSLSNKIIMEKDLFSKNYQGLHPNTILFNVTNKTNKPTDYQSFEEILFYCERLNINKFYADENDNIFYYLYSNSSFFKGQKIEKRLVLKNNYFREVYEEDKQVKNLCDIKVFGNYYYVVDKISD